MLITNREREVLNLVAYEYTSNQIAQLLYLSPHTIISHRKSLMNKLNARSLAGMVRRGCQLGLIDESNRDIIALEYIQ